MPVSADEIEIRSEEVQDILSAIPHWLIRWGMTVIFLSVGMLVAASFFIKYPDTIDSRLVLTTQLPPARVVARSSGNLSFFVEDKAEVEEDAILGVIENPANTEDVLALQQKLSPFASEWQRGGITNDPAAWNQDWQLGTLQPSFLSFRNALLNYNRFISLDFYTQQIAALQERIASYRQLNRSLENQLKIFEQEVALTRKKFEVDSMLYAKKSIPEIDYNNSRNTLLTTIRSFESSSNQIISNRITISQLQAQIGELQLQREKEHDELTAAIEEALQNLEAQLTAWRQQFLLEASIPGTVSFSNYWSDNQFVNANDEVLSIIPDSTLVNKQTLIGQMLSPIRNSGKLEVGQRVNIRFDNYPANEYGMVVGEVSNISLVPREDFYTVQVRLPQGLQTTYNRNLDYRPEMSASAQVITEDLRLIDRIFNQFRALVDRTRETG